jgi:hypothetical protein
VHPAGHVAREAVDRRFLPEDLLELGGVGVGDRRGVEAGEPAANLERARKSLLHGDLLVEDEPDEQRQRLLGEKAVGFVVTCEVEMRRAGRGHAHDSSHALVTFRDALDTLHAPRARLSALASKAGGGRGVPLRGKAGKPPSAA